MVSLAFRLQLRLLLKLFETSYIRFLLWNTSNMRKRSVCSTPLCLMNMFSKESSVNFIDSIEVRREGGKSCSQLFTAFRRFLGRSKASIEIWTYHQLLPQTHLLRSRYLRSGWENLTRVFSWNVWSDRWHTSGAVFGLMKSSRHEFSSNLTRKQINFPRFTTAIVCHVKFRHKASISRMWQLKNCKTARELCARFCQTRAASN